MFCTALPGVQFDSRQSITASVQRHLDRVYLRPFSLQSLADLFDVSPGHLLHMFSRSYGKPPRAYVIELRVRRAKELLEAGLPIKQIPELCGFYDQSHLTRHFKRIVGETPARFLAKQGKVGAESCAVC